MTDNEWIDEKLKVTPLDQLAHSQILHALKVAHGNITVASKLLNRCRATLSAYVAKHGLQDHVAELKTEGRRLMFEMNEADRAERRKLKREALIREMVMAREVLAQELKKK